MAKETTHIRVPVEVAQGLTTLARGRGCSVAVLLDGLLRDSAADPEVVQHMIWVQHFNTLVDTLAILQQCEEEIDDVLADAAGSTAVRYTSKVRDAATTNLEEIIAALDGRLGVEGDAEDDGANNAVENDDEDEEEEGEDDED